MCHIRVFKLESLKLESFCSSSKEPSEVGKFRCSLKVLAEVGKGDSDVGNDFGMLLTELRCW